jgi:hypothetical protein
MAISTDTQKLAIMEYCQVWEPGLPLSPGTLGQDDRQQLLWGFPGVLWEVSTLVFILDMNTRIISYLASFYSADITVIDPTALIVRYLNEELSGDYTNRFRQLIDDATP